MKPTYPGSETERAEERCGDQRQAATGHGGGSPVAEDGRWPGRSAPASRPRGWCRPAPSSVPPRCCTPGPSARSAQWGGLQDPERETRWASSPAPPGFAQTHFNGSSLGSPAYPPAGRTEAGAEYFHRGEYPCLLSRRVSGTRRDCHGIF